MDRNGLGHNPATCLVEPWWAKVFNQTAQNVSVEEFAETSDRSKSAEKRKRDKSTKDACRTQTESEESSTVNKKIKTSKRKQRLKDNNVLESNGKSSAAPDLNEIKRATYKNFVKSSTAFTGTDGSTKEDSSDSRGIVDGKGNVVESSDLKKDSKKMEHDEQIVNPIDHDVWKSCEGRTGHKGARYGVLKGKMARVLRQESQHLMSKATAT